MLIYMPRAHVRDWSYTTYDPDDRLVIFTRRGERLILCPSSVDGGHSYELDQDNLPPNLVQDVPRLASLLEEFSDGCILSVRDRGNKLTVDFVTQYAIPGVHFSFTSPITAGQATTAADAPRASRCKVQAHGRRR